MSDHLVRRRGVSLVALTTAAGLLAALPAITSGPAAAEPAADCAVGFPVEELVAGQPVTGLTVSSGTTPEAFDGEVLGVLEDGIAPGVDMVMMDLDSPAIDAVGGIWQGMSGSPVYAADGRVIGAVAYGLAYGTTKVAGITPFAEMDDYLDAPVTAKRTARVPAKLARAIAAGSDATVAQATQGVRQLPMPLGVSGISARRLEQAKDRRYLSRSTYAVGRAGGAAAPGPDTIVAGGNMAAGLSYGDIGQVGVGTVTSVCRGQVVGFGHPMTFGGATSLSLHPADAIYVQEDPLGVPFKVANVGAPAGTITDDRGTGLTGAFGAGPDTLDVESTVTFGSRSRTGTSHVTVPAAAAETTFYQGIANHDRVVDGVLVGSETQEWTIRGTDVDGSAFTIEHDDRFVSDYDISQETAYELPDLVYELTSLPGVTVDSVSSDAVVSDDATTYTVRRLQQRRKGAWVTVGRSKPVLAEAGTKLRLRAVLTAGSQTRYAAYSFALPRKAAGTRGTFSAGVDEYEEFFGDESMTGTSPTRTAAAVARDLAAQPRNDQTTGQLFLGGRRVSFNRTVTSARVNRVVKGFMDVRVRVR